MFALSAGEVRAEGYFDRGCKDSVPVLQVRQLYLKGPAPAKFEWRYACIGGTSGGEGGGYTGGYPMALTSAQRLGRPPRASSEPAS